MKLTGSETRKRETERETIKDKSNFGGLPDGNWEHHQSVETSVCSGNQENDHS